MNKKLLYNIFLLLPLFVQCGNKSQPVAAGNESVFDTVRFFSPDTIYINQDWNIDNLKFGHSTVADFEVFRSRRQIQFEESHPAAHSDEGIIDSLGNIIGMRALYHISTDFINDSLGLKFVFSAQACEWKEFINKPPELLDEVICNNRSAVKFYNGVTLQSTIEEVIESFGAPARETPIEYAKEKNQTMKFRDLNYIFNDSVIVRFTFKNDTIWFVYIDTTR